MTISDLVTVVVPVYNGEEFLRENIDCIINQSYKNLEIIYICAGCSDSSVNILEEYLQLDSRMRIHVEAENHGPAGSRNIGKKMAKGEWIIFLDCDDLFEHDMIEIMLTEAIKKKADICCCFWDVFDHEIPGKVYASNRFFKLCCKTYPNINVENEKQHIFQLVSPNVWSKLFHKTVYKKDNVSFMKFSNCEDFYFSLSAAMEAKRIAYVDQNLVHYRSNTDRLTQTTMMDSKTSSIWEVLDLIFCHINNREGSMELKQSFYNCVCRYTYDLSVRSMIYDKLFSELQNTYIEKWGMKEANIIGKLSYFNQEILKKMHVGEMSLNTDEMRMKAKVHCIKDLAEKEKCSIYGCGYHGQKLLEQLMLKGIQICHIYDSDQKKWGEYFFGKKVEKFTEDQSEIIVVPNEKYYQEIKRQIGKRAKKVCNLTDEIMVC